jgi:two-component system LytT family sensor kinase
MSGPIPPASGSAGALLDGRFAPRTNFWLLQTGGWTLFGAVMLIWGLDYWSRQDAIVNKLMLVCTGIVLTLLLRVLYRRLLAGPTGMPMLLAKILAAAFIGGAVWFELEMLLFQMYLGSKAKVLILKPVAIPLGMCLFYGFVLLAWSLLYLGIHTQAEADKQRARALQAEAAAQAAAQTAKLQALRSQLEPHFLFNTLNCISTLIVEQKSDLASEMISRLSDFLRMTLDAGEVTQVSVAEELDFVRRYVEIQALRFGDRLNVKIEADPQVLGARVPVLILQPLIENAVKHGILPSETGGTIKVRVVGDNGTLRLSVEDPGNSSLCEGRAGLGLANARSRLSELYGENARLELHRTSSGSTVAVIEINRVHATKGRTDDPDDHC